MTIASDRRDPVRLEDAIDEAALDGRRWPLVLLGLANLALASNALLLLATDGDMRVVAAGRSDDATVDLPGLQRDQPTTSHFVRLGPPAPGEQLTALFVSLPDGHRAAVVLPSEADIATTRLARLNALAPLLIRTILVAARIADSNMAAAVNSLGSLGYAAAAVTRAARVVKRNDRFAEWAATAPVSAGRQFALVDANANTAWLRALEACLDTGEPLVVPTQTQHWESVLHLVPLGPGDESSLSMAQALVIITPPAGRRAQPDLLSKLFDFTPSEAAIAQRLVEGQTLEEIAGITDRSILTVRTQAKKVLAKAGARRQAEFVGMMTRLLPGL